MEETLTAAFADRAVLAAEYVDFLRIAVPVLTALLLSAADLPAGAGDLGVAEYV